MSSDLGCKVKRPDDVISESKMENLLYDYHVAKSMGDNLPYSENYKKALYIDAVFKKYGTTQAAFDSSMVWYTRNTEILSKIYDKVKKRLKDEQELVGDLIAKRDKKPKMTKQGDSIDVWPWQCMIRLTGEMMNNQYVFTLPTDSNYKDRDTLVWEVRYRFLEPMLADSLRGVTMAMQVIYEKDTINHWKTVTEPGVQQIRLFADTLGSMKEIKGFIYYPMDSQEKGGAVLADRFMMTRYHCTDTLAFAVRDSLNKIEALKADSLKKIATKENGKPYFVEHRDIYFNLSHSGEYAVCVIGNTENGIDIEGKREIRDINMEFNARYVRGDMDKEERRSCPM